MKIPPAKTSPTLLPQPGITRTNDRLGTTGHLQLTENGGDVVAHRFRTEHQLFCDSWIRIALRDQGQDLTFTLRQLGERLGRDAWTGCAKVLHEPPGDGWAEDRLTAADDLKGTHHLVSLGPFQQIAACS